MRINVSIHAPAWGATYPGVMHGQLFPGFNPRTRVGCDLIKQATGCDMGQFQSTHPRGVRPQAMMHPSRCAISFNPRTRVGCDRSRRSAGGMGSASFNPRTRVGCDLI